MTAQSGCTLTAMPSSSGAWNCPTVGTTNKSGISLYVYGASFLPLGGVDLDMTNSSDLTIEGGLVVRQLRTFAPAATTPPAPLSSGPLPGGAGTSARTVVLLTVYVCQGASSCTTGGSVQLKAKVAISDPNGTPGTNGQRPTTVLSWSVQR
jgi:hypothetical protein